MPNHVRNVLKMRGIASLPLYSEGLNGADNKKHFDFNKLIPMPESLDLEFGLVTDYAIETGLRHIVDILRKESIFNNENLDVSIKRVRGMTLESYTEQDFRTKNELVELGLAYLSNIINHGHSTWYYWCIDNWGTKWNSYDLDLIDDDTISFSTAWSSPSPIIKALALNYADRKIEHWWADEDVGTNAGHELYRNGKLIYVNDCDENALEHYVVCWGMDDMLYRDENGKLRIIEEQG